MPFGKLLVLGALAVAAHNLEEALFMPAWIEERLPALLQQWGLGAVRLPSRARLYAALLVVTVVPVAILAWGARAGPRSRGRQAALVIAAVFFWNALVPHIASAILLRAYTPGVVTAALVNLPYTLHLFRRAAGEGEVSRAALAAILAGTAVAYTLAMWWWATSPQ